MNATLPAPRPAAIEVGPLLRAMVGIVGVGFTTICVLALGRVAAGLAPDHPGAHSLAVMIHLATVVPAVPLGAYLMLARKGTPRHRSLGKVWVGLMVTTALAAFFIRQLNSGAFSPIHIFVPLTIHGAWKTIATARRHDIAAHKRALVGLYLGALVIPGIFSFMPGRLMSAWLVG